MARFANLHTAVLTLTLFLLVSIGAAQEPLRGQPIALFDGTSMDGWAKRDGSPNKGWEIQNGTLHKSKRAGDLYYAQWFDSFELVFEWKLEKGGNSGVKYRVMDYGKQSLGCEFQCQDDNTFKKTSAGSLYALYAPDEEKRKLSPIGEWNSAKIVVCGQKIEHWLNGELVVSAEVGSLDWLQRVAESKFKDKPYFGQNRFGRIFLQDHGNPVWFRNIVLTPLVCTEQQPIVAEFESTMPTTGTWNQGYLEYADPNLNYQFTVPQCDCRMVPLLINDFGG